MKNCLIMGFGRSGTSLMGGILHQAGYYMGEDLYPARHSNPVGFFECALINGINEEILSPFDYKNQNIDYPKLDKTHSPYAPGIGHRWLSYIPEKTQISFHNHLVEQQIKESVSISNYAYKDPRFNYTLNTWMPFLKKDTLFLCMFRNPSDTIDSVVKECSTAEYLADFTITQKLTEMLWQNSYSHLLHIVKQNPDRKFVFIHYNQLLDGSVMDMLSSILMADINSYFVDNSLNRTSSNYIINRKTQRIYKHLCQLANYKSKNPSIAFKIRHYLFSKKQ